MVYIGIDLGTTYSCVAVVENGRPVVITSDDGKRTIPSVVAYFDGGILVGNPAITCNTDLSNILYDSKRLIGWHIVNNLPNSEDKQLWTFNVYTRNNSAGYVLNRGKSNEKFLKPEEVSAEILKYLKKYAEKYLSKEVTGCVVTVPAIFNEPQLSATKRAVEMAGLNLIELLHEPTAAAIAYNQKNKLDNSTILLFDWGGGTLDVAIAEMKNDQVSIKAVSGEPHLGGQDIDARIMKFVNEESKESQGYDIFKKANSTKRLRRICREAKEALSFNINSYNIQMDIGERELNVELSREKLHDLCKDIFERAMNLVDQALNTAGMTADSINHVILVGGTTRMPIIQQLLEKKFGKSKLKFDINPDEAIALGAAVYASSTQVAERKRLLETCAQVEMLRAELANYEKNKGIWLETKKKLEDLELEVERLETEVDVKEGRAELTNRLQEVEAKSEKVRLDSMREMEELREELREATRRAKRAEEEAEKNKGIAEAEKKGRLAMENEVAAMREQLLNNANLLASPAFSRHGSVRHPNAMNDETSSNAESSLDGFIPTKIGSGDLDEIALILRQQQTINELRSRNEQAHRENDRLKSIVEANSLIDNLERKTSLRIFEAQHMQALESDYAKLKQEFERLVAEKADAGLANMNLKITFDRIIEENERRREENAELKALLSVAPKGN